MEHMNNKDFDAQLWNVLEKHKLGDLSQYHRPDFFDEAPLYTRKSDVGFLPSGARANEIILRFALKFLSSVIAYERHTKSYFAAITIWDIGDSRIVPNIFAWCRPIEELEAKLDLKPTTAAFSKRIGKMIPKLGLSDRIKILEDAETELGSTRVFIGPMVAPYRGFFTLDHFRSPALHAK